jgi:hypothetical protein
MKSVHTSATRAPGAGPTSVGNAGLKIAVSLTAYAGATATASD